MLIVAVFAVSITLVRILLTVAILIRAVPVPPLRRRRADRDNEADNSANKRSSLLNYRFKQTLHLTTLSQHIHMLSTHFTK